MKKSKVIKIAIEAIEMRIKPLKIYVERYKTEARWWPELKPKVKRFEEYNEAISILKEWLVDDIDLIKEEKNGD
jgi:hypothetical protein